MTEERPTPDLDHVRDAMREHDERPEEPPAGDRERNDRPGPGEKEQEEDEEADG